MLISLCMIVRDEENVLRRCLESAKGWADEIVIVDTGSKDGTPAIAKEYADVYAEFPWVNDFSRARNFAFSLARGEYCAWLDADDVAEGDGEALRDLLRREAPDMVICPYQTGETVFSRERFLRRECNFLWQGRVHECIAPRGKILSFPFPIRHLQSQKDRSTRNLDIYRIWAAEEALSPRDLFYYGRELYYHRLYPEAIAILDRSLAGKGWYVNRIETCRILSLCYGECGEREQAKKALFNSFLYGEPRAVLCYRLGTLFEEEKRYREAVYWYESAIRCRDHSAEGDFEIPHCRDLFPLLGETVCYYAMGEREHAFACHKKTEEIAPDHPSVRFNRAFFAGCGKP